MSTAVQFDLASTLDLQDLRGEQAYCIRHGRYVWPVYLWRSGCELRVCRECIEDAGTETVRVEKGKEEVVNNWSSGYATAGTVCQFEMACVDRGYRYCKGCGVNCCFKHIHGNDRCDTCFGKPLTTTTTPCASGKCSEPASKQCRVCGHDYCQDCLSWERVMTGFVCVVCKPVVDSMDSSGMTFGHYAD